MRELFFRSLKPPGQLWFLLLICSVSFLLFSVFAASVVTTLFGFDLLENPEQLSQFQEPFVLAANKVLLLIQHLGLFILPALIFNQAFTFKRGPSFMMWGETPKLTKIFQVMVIMLAAFPVINFLLALNERMVLPSFLSGMEAEMKAMEQQAGNFTIQLVSVQGTGALLVNLLIMAVIPALGEEFLFRGVIQKIIARWSGKLHLAIWISAALFSAMHMQFYGFLPRLLLGALFGYVSIWMGSIWYAVVAHFINNAASLLLNFFIQRKEIPEEVDQFGSLSSHLPYFLLFTVILSLLLWMAWKNSVFGKLRVNYLNHPYLIIRNKEEEPPVNEEEDSAD